jgi:hypothetical protein
MIVFSTYSFRDRLTVGRLLLEQKIGVRFPVSEPPKLLASMQGDEGLLNYI